MYGASLVAQLGNNPPAMWETWVRSLGWEEPWSRERLPTSVFWPGEVHGLYSLWGRKESDTTERLALIYSCVLCFHLHDSTWQTSRHAIYETQAPKEWFEYLTKK